MNQDAMFTRVREGGLLSFGQPVLVLLSGDEIRPACSTSRSAWPVRAP